MPSFLRRAVLLFAAPVALAAQAPQPTAAYSYGVSGFAGGVQRSASGKKENGSRIMAGVALLHPQAQVGALSVAEVSAAFAQMNTSAGNYAVRENSFEFGAIADVVTMAQSSWHLDAGLGLVLSRSLGCATDGSDTKSSGVSVACVHAFANSGTSLLGYRARVVSNWGGAYTTVMVGLDLSGHTIAAGSSVVPSFFVGARYSLGPIGH
ncbi:MAG: hypothetical protein NTU67_09440 [Gemmatimonadetes bacterium]|nr:hypothetical protein [Gemmatimonadota bacterium]